jgi:hypothetical protein
VTYTFDVAADAAFATKVQSKSGVAAGSGGQTSVTLDTLAGGKDYFWRASAQTGGITGAFTAVSAFTVGAQLTLAAPGTLSPASGAAVGSRPTFTVSNAARLVQTGSVTYTFEVATNPAFSPLTLSGSAPEGAGTTSYTASIDLPGGITYYWRAAAVDVSSGVTSPPSAAQSFSISVSQAGRIAAQQGVVLWPGAQPPGSPGRAVMGDGWGIGTASSFTGVGFSTPPLDELRMFDLLDHGISDPAAAIGWLQSNGYVTQAFWVPEVQAIGYQWDYMALISGVWKLVHRVGA